MDRGSPGSSFAKVCCAALFVLSFTAQEWRVSAGVIAWGDNSHSQINVPAGLTDAAAVAGGSFHSLALRRDGTVVGWGDDSFGAIDVPPGLPRLMAIAAGSGFSLALQSDGTVFAWGSQTNTPVLPTDIIVSIAAAGQNAMALKSDGTVIAWGTVSNVPTDATNVVAIAAGTAHDLALRGDGTVVAWGDDYLGKATVPPGLTDVVAVAAGEFHSMALKADGTVVVWGDNTYGQKNVPAGLSDVVAISAGALHNLAIRRNGDLAAWGDNTYHQGSVPSGLSNAVAVAIASGRYHNLAVTGDGSPAITIQPANQVVAANQNATFHVMAAGRGPLAYQWQRDGTNLIGQTSATLVVPNVRVEDAGAYSVVVSNSLGRTQSVRAALALRDGAPTLAIEPRDQAVACGDAVRFDPFVSGLRPVNYQWQFNGTPLAGATNLVLKLEHAAKGSAGQYSLVAANAAGSVTSRVAALTVTPATPLIATPLSISGVQGVPFSYFINALHAAAFSGFDLPGGLIINPATGEIHGTPLESGNFNATIIVANDCSSASTNLLLTIASAAPVITSSRSVSGTEGTPLNYQIAATGSPASFGARNLPVGLFLDAGSGLISGTPVYAGTYSSTVFATNQWGVGSATIQFGIASAQFSFLSVDDVSPEYHSPYLLDFLFTLRGAIYGGDNTIRGVVARPNLMSGTAVENLTPGVLSVTWPPDFPRLPTATNLIPHALDETSAFLGRSSDKVIKIYLVLDYTESISDPAINGDSNGDGISDAVDNMVAGAKYFVDQKPGGVQVGVFEFHRDDLDPQRVIGLTTKRGLLDSAIGGIWTNVVKGFYAGSRCWDAVDAAIAALGQWNPDEEHYVVFVSDGRDYSSTVNVDQIISDAYRGAVKVYCIGFGRNPDTTTLERITTRTRGRFYLAQSPVELSQQFSLLSKDIQAQYVFRWATIRRDTNSTIKPFFLISYQGLTAQPPLWTWTVVTNIYEQYITNTTVTIDTNSVPPMTNMMETIQTNSMTNIFVDWRNSSITEFNPGAYAGPVTEGVLRLVLDEEVAPSSITLRAAYIPRYVRQLRLHYLPNWPCTPVLDATDSGEMLHGWSLTDTADPDGSHWLLLSSPDPANQATSLPFPGFGPLVTFKFNDIITNQKSAFAFITVDNSVYTNVSGGGQTFAFESGDNGQFTTWYGTNSLPLGTPVPWLVQNGFTNNFAAAELEDSDGDGMPNWQEYRAGTDPRDPNSVLAIRDVEQTGPFNRYQITFSTVVNHTYRLEVSSDLVTWFTVADNIQGTGGDLTVTDNRDPAGHHTSFYRIVLTGRQAQ